MQPEAPTTREEAVQILLREGFTISRSFAVAVAFPLPGEREQVFEFLDKLAGKDPGWAAYLRDTMTEILNEWGFDERGDKMWAQDAMQFAAQQARANMLKEKARPVFEALRGEKNVQKAIEIAKRKRGRRLIRVLLAIDHTGKTCEAMQVSITHTPLRKPGDKANGASKYEIGKYYVGMGTNPNLPGIISGPFDGAVSVEEGQTLYVYDSTFGLVEVE